MEGTAKTGRVKPRANAGIHNDHGAIQTTGHVSRTNETRRREPDVPIYMDSTASTCPLGLTSLGARSRCEVEGVNKKDLFFCRIFRDF